MTSTRQCDESNISIGFVSPGWPPEAIANGIASYTGTIVRGLQQLGTNVRVLTLRPMSERIDDFVRIVCPDMSSFYSKVRRRLSPEAWPQKAFCIALGQELLKLQADHQLDLVEMEESYGWASILPQTVPIVVRLHGPWFLNGIANGATNDASFRWRDKMEAKGLMAASAVTAPSADVLKRTREHFGLALPRSAIIPNPVGLVTEKDQWRLSDCDPKRITFIGRFDRHKGGDIMLDAFARVLAAEPEARLDFVGPDRGCINDNRRMWSFKQYLREKLPASAQQATTFHDFLPAPKAAELRKRALVTVVPSRYETFGITAAEAMMAGCPLVVGGAGALTELVQDGVNGLVSRPGDADDLAEKILSMLKNPDRAARLGAQAAVDAKLRYDPVVVAKQTQEFYRTVI
jgi:glycosyltransferase involved in cell wall biosynthesis